MAPIFTLCKELQNSANWRFKEKIVHYDLANPNRGQYNTS